MSSRLSDGETRQVMVRMDPEMHRAIKNRAASEDRTMAQEIRRAVRLHLGPESSPPRPV